MGRSIDRQKSVFQYLDFREYLQDFFDCRKIEQPWFSYKVMGDGVGLDQSQVYRILQGQLQISRAALPRFLEYLNLQGKEAEYFCKMVAFARARKTVETRKLFAELLALRGNRCQTLEQAQLELYREWHHPVVRALLGIISITNNYEILAQTLDPAITVAQAKQSVELLNKLKLVERNREGVWELTGNSISTGSSYQSLLIRQYQAHSFRLAEQSLDRHPKENRDFNVMNIAVDDEAFHDCSVILKEARRQIQQRIERVETPNRILRLAQALFPVTHPREDKP